MVYVFSDAMRLYEHEAKKVFHEMGIPIPKQYGIINSPNELEKMEMEFPVMLKSMVLVGGRGKAGGIRKAGDMEEAKIIAEKLLNMNIRGYKVNAVLIEEALEAIHECYIGITMDPITFENVIMASAYGGMDIEKLAKEKPDDILKIKTLNDESAIKKLASFLSKKLDRSEEELYSLVSKLYEAYQKFDAKVCEINPLMVTDDGIIAADAKIVLDDNALFRQSQLLKMLGITEKRHDVSEPTRNEVRAYNAGIPYVDLLPENASKDPEKIYVGLVPGGAGYGIFSIDEVINIGKRFFDGKLIPVNFMDSGGGPSQDKVAEMFHLLMDNPLVDVIITSRFGGISSCDVFIRGLIQALRERYEKGKRIIPVYGRMVGTDLPSARNFLEKAMEETPDALKDMEIVVGNQKIMADVIKESIEKYVVKHEN